MKPIEKLRKIRSLISERASLDTHIWLWAFLEPHNPLLPFFSASVTRKMCAFLSTVSIWEAILLLEKKRLKVELSLTVVGMSWRVAHELRFTWIVYSDPADRFACRDRAGL